MKITTFQYTTATSKELTVDVAPSANALSFTATRDSSLATTLTLSPTSGGSGGFAVAIGKSELTALRDTLTEILDDWTV